MEKIASFLNKHWLIYSIIVFLPSLAGIFTKLLNFNNWWSWCIVFILLTLNFFSVLISNQVLKKFKSYEDECKFHKCMRSYLNQMMDGKYNELHKCIDVNQKELQIPNTAYYAKLIDESLKCLVKTISDFCKINADEITPGIIYTIDNKKWMRISITNPHLAIEIDELLKNPNTASYDIIVTKKKEYVYYDDKKIALDNGNYLPDKNDFAHSNVGSILCYGINIDSIQTEKKSYLRALLCVNTYGKKFSHSYSMNEKYVRYFIINEIMPMFIREIKQELAQLYLCYENSLNKAQA